MTRPSSYKPEFAGQLIEHMKEGLSFKSFGGIVLKSERTLHNWCEAHPDFQEAKEIGECACLLFWEKLGRGAGRDFNTVLWIVNMCNRFGWRQRAKEEVEGESGAQKGPEVALSNEALVKIIQAARGPAAASPTKEKGASS
jgi:hypothetical protein